MPRHLRSLVVVAILIPSVASAQRGGGGGGGSRTGSDTSMRRMRTEQGSGPRYATRGDIEDLSPAAFLRDKRKKLQLDDAAVTALKAAESTARDRNAPLLATYDSLRRELIRVAGQPEADPNAATLRRVAFAHQMDLVREARVRDRADALAAIPDAKRPAADDLLKENDEDFDKKMSAGTPRTRGDA